MQEQLSVLRDEMQEKITTLHDEKTRLLVQIELLSQKDK